MLVRDPRKLTQTKTFYVFKNWPAFQRSKRHELFMPQWTLWNHVKKNSNLKKKCFCTVYFCSRGNGGKLLCGLLIVWGPLCSRACQQTVGYKPRLRYNARHSMNIYDISIKRSLAKKKFKIDDRNFIRWRRCTKKVSFFSITFDYRRSGQKLRQCRQKLYFMGTHFITIITVNVRVFWTVKLITKSLPSGAVFGNV